MGLPSLMIWFIFCEGEGGNVGYNRVMSLHAGL